MIPKTATETILILVAESFWVLSALSQLLRLLKTRNRKGLFAPTQALNGAGNIAWITYFTSNQLFVPATTNLANLLITVTTMGYTLGDKKQFKRGVIAILTIGPLTSYLLVTHPSQSGWVGVAYNLIASTPWVFHIIRTKKTSGLSQRSFFFSISAMLCTFTYALMVRSVPLVTGCVLGMTTTGIVIRYYYRYRYRR